MEHRHSWWAHLIRMDKPIYLIGERANISAVTTSSQNYELMLQFEMKGHNILHAVNGAPLV